MSVKWVSIFRLFNSNRIFRLKYSTKSVLQTNFEQKYVLNENSLEKRLLTYIKPQYIWNQKNVTLAHYDQKNITTINNDELLNLIGALGKFKHKDIQKCVNNLDLECRSRLTYMENSETLLFLFNFVTTVPYYVKNLPFLSQALHKMSFFIEHLPKIDLVRLCFYTGLKKKTYESQNIIRHCLNKLNNSSELTTDDLIIICNSAFKTGMKINQKKLLNVIKKRLSDELSILKDPPYFITIVKSLRHNYNYDEELLLMLSNTIFFNKTLDLYNFTALSHILALYADALYYDSTLLDAINEKCISYIRKTKNINLVEHLSKQLRLKDICRYLWSLSYLGYEDLFDEDIKDHIIPTLKEFINLSAIEDNIEDLVGTLLSLWVLGYYPVELLGPVLQKNALLKGLIYY